MALTGTDDKGREGVDRYDAVVVGGGPAGLSAALILGRSRRRVLLATAGEPRNAVAAAAHSVFTRDGAPPEELIRIGREQLGPYDVSIREAQVIDVDPSQGGFRVSLGAPDVVEPTALAREARDVEPPTATEPTAEVWTRKILLAIGIRDLLPTVRGLREAWGNGVYHCPYCHGWEVRDRPIGVYARGEVGFVFARKLLAWSDDVILFTDGDSELTTEQADRLGELGVTVREDALERLVAAAGGGLEAVVLESGEAVPRRALFLHTENELRSDLPRRLGCAMDEKGCVDADEGGETNVRGVYVAGDAAPNPQQVIFAAASGARAAAAINEALIEEDFPG